MANGIDTFMQNAKGLTRNPLGIIALFISLIYVFATLLCATAVSNLTPSERQILLWFVVLFPIIVLGFFYKLVAEHHSKLYAPHDFQSDKSFLLALTQEQQNIHLEEEVESIRQLTQAECNVDAAPSSFDDEREAVDKVETELISKNGRNKIRNTYLLAEKLALQKLEQDLCVKIEEHVAIGDDRAAYFDGVAIDENKRDITFIEIKYLRYPVLPSSAIREILFRVIIAEEKLKFQYRRYRMKLMLVLVSSLEEEKTNMLKKMITKISHNYPYEVEIKYFKFEKLKEQIE